uniref:SGNH hydrolase-type esterase domain-containing protein n=1 Tax=Astyanax mexicanus TaxID=7994 RepID=A0A3B1JEG4_ASTMX
MVYKGSTLIVGDSIVRHLKVSNAKGNAAVSCFPGARVLDVARRLPTVLRHRGDPGTVILHVGTNDTSARRSEVLKEHFCTLLDTARRLTRARLLISGPMPTYRRGSQPFSRLYALHCWLRDWCSASGISYVDNWESFRERPALFHRDGLHPSRLGSTVLSGNIEAVLRRD